MRIHRVAGWVIGVILAGSVGLAEQWEIGAEGGYNFSHDLSLRRGTVTANTGFSRGGSFSVFAGQQWTGRLGGELRYTYRDSDPRLSSGSTTLVSSGRAHMVHYDALVYGAPSEAKVRPFIAFGGGIKDYRVTGQPADFQPLGSLATLSTKGELKPMASVGGGVKLRIADHIAFRIDFRDYITPFPSKLVAPAAGSSVKGWLHDFAPMVGISAIF